MKNALPKLDFHLDLKAKDNKTGFSPRTSATIVAVIAGLSVIAGVILVLTGLFWSKSAENMLLIYIGGGLIVSSVYMFVIYNLVTDVQALSYDTNIQLENNNQYQEEVLQLLQDINNKLDAINK